MVRSGPPLPEIAAPTAQRACSVDAGDDPRWLIRRVGSLNGQQDDRLVVYWKGPPGEISMTAKDTVRALLDRLPDDCSLDDVQYHLYVVQAVGGGLADGEAGRVIPHEQVAADLRRKWLVGSAK